jgi:AraC-like DNA-binding protein
MNEVNSLLNKTLNLTEVIGVISLILSLYFSIHLRLQQKKKSNRSLSFFFLLFTLIQFFSLVFDLGYKVEATFLIGVFVSARLCMPPMLYIYLEKVANKKQESSFSTFPHFIVPLFFGLAVIILLTISFSLNQQSELYRLLTRTTLYLTLFAHFFVFILLNIIYVYKSYKIISRHQFQIDNYFSYDEGINLRWTKILIWGYIFFTLLTCISDVFPNFPEWIYNLFVISFISFIGYNGIHQSDIFTTTTVEVETGITEESKESSETESTQAEDKFKSLLDRIINLMIFDKIYLNQDLTIVDLTKILNVNSKYIAQSISNEYNVNFVNFINSYRVEYAKKLLKDSSYSNYTIEAIGQTSGFKSKSAFYNAFKKTTGLTPSEYKG